METITLQKLSAVIVSGTALVDRSLSIQRIGVGCRKYVLSLVTTLLWSSHALTYALYFPVAYSKSKILSFA